MDKVYHVVALGGGYVTIYVMKSLRKYIKQGLVRVTVIDKNNYHVFHGLVAEMLTGKIQPGNITSPSRTVFKGADFHNGEITKVDFENREVITNRFLDGKEHKVKFDHLIIGLGSRDDLSRYAGVAENTFRLKSYWDVFELRNHITSVFEMAEIEEDKEERQRLLTFIIAGGNYAGVEVATELSEYAQELTEKYYPRINYDEVRVILLHSRDSILPELGERFPKLVNYANKFIANNTNVKVLLNTKIISATPLAAITDSNGEIQTRTIINCTGNAQSPLFDEWKFERDKFGRLTTDKYLNVTGQKNIWAGGDCASVPHPKGGTCPPLAIYAMKAGAQIGNNIIRSLQNKKLKEYKFTGLGDACSLARRRAVGHLYGIQVTGFIAWLAWRLFMVAYLPIIDRRVRTIFDWLAWPIIGRDVVSIKANHKLQVKELYFEPGQVVIQQGDAGNGMFLISSGEVDVIKDGNQVATLKKGEHFGEIAVFENCKRTATIISKTRIKLLEIKRDAAMLLKDSINTQKI